MPVAKQEEPQDLFEDDAQERDLEFPAEEKLPEGVVAPSKPRLPSWAATLIKFLPILITLAATALSVMGFEEFSEGLSQIARIVRELANP